MNLFTGLISEFAASILTDERVLNSFESQLYRQGAHLSGWSASKLEYAARSLRRQEAALHVLADRTHYENSLPVPRNNRRVTRARELSNLIQACWKE